MMGRFLMYATIALLAVFVLASYTMLEHGGEGLGQVQTLTVERLTNPASANAYNGSQVRVEGTLVFNNDAREYELTGDRANYPVGIRGFDDGLLKGFVDKTVVVSGKFVYHNAEGTYIEGASIHEATPATPLSGS
jgi:hypothetical protein